MLRLLSNDVTAICKAQWPSNSTDCNAFVKAVAGDVGVTLTGNADSIVNQISGSGWTHLQNDGVAASAAAADGKLVVGGLTAKDLGDSHGHVVIVVPPTGRLGHDKYPYAYWGSLDDGDVRKNGGLGTTVNYAVQHRDPGIRSSTPRGTSKRFLVRGISVIRPRLRRSIPKRRRLSHRNPRLSVVCTVDTANAATSLAALAFRPECLESRQSACGHNFGHRRWHRGKAKVSALAESRLQMACR